MKWISALTRSVRASAAAIRRRLSSHRHQARVHSERVDEFPDALRPATLYVAGEDAYLFAAAMLCPCGCGDTIELNLLPQANPCWIVHFHGDGSASLTPSVWRTKGCKSHFLLRMGRVDWCRAAETSR